MQAQGLEVPALADSVGRLLVEAFEQTVETDLIQPTFVIDYPVENSPLARAHRSKPGLVERFELFMVGLHQQMALSSLHGVATPKTGSSFSHSIHGSLEFLEQPQPNVVPLALGRGFGDAQGFGRLRDAQADEVSELHQFGALR